ETPGGPTARRTNVSSRTYQSRGMKKDGRKCRSSQDWFAATAHRTSAAPTIVVAISTVKRPSEDRDEAMPSFRNTNGFTTSHYASLASHDGCSETRSAARPDHAADSSMGVGRRRPAPAQAARV